VGSIPGSVDSGKVVLLCAHLDSKSEKRLRYAPGADDNASGCAAVLEAARVLSKHRFENTVRFLIFAEEETGQHGSRAYVKGIEGSGEEIIGAINLDMIAYGGRDEAFDLVTRPKHRWLADYVEGVSRAFAIPTRKVVRKECF
jgi:leucyl aminopeptidase